MTSKLSSETLTFSIFPFGVPIESDLYKGLVSVLNQCESKEVFFPQRSEVRMGQQKMSQGWIQLSIQYSQIASSEEEHPLRRLLWSLCCAQARVFDTARPRGEAFHLGPE